MNRLTALVNELETKIQHSEKMNHAVSRSSVGWHIQHSLLVASQIFTAVENRIRQNTGINSAFRNLLFTHSTKFPGEGQRPQKG